MYYHFINLIEKSFGWFAYVGGQRMGFEAILEHPITGVGLNNLGNYFASKFGLFIGSRGFFGPVSYVAQNGLLGVVGLGVFLWGFLKIFLQKKSYLEKRLSKDCRSSALFSCYVVYDNFWFRVIQSDYDVFLE